MGNWLQKDKNDPKVRGMKIEAYYNAMKGSNAIEIGDDEKEFRTEAVKFMQYNWTLLHLAVWFLNADMVKVLIKAGFDANTCDIVTLMQYDETPLHIAAYQGSEKIYKMLVKAEANEDMKNKVRVKVGRQDS